MPSSLNNSTLCDDDEIIQTINDKFFSKNFDFCNDFLSNIKFDFKKDEYIINRIEKLEIQLRSVSSKILERVNEHHDDFVNGMQHIQSINMDLLLAKKLCSFIRNSFSVTKRDVLEKSASIILSNLRKKHVQSIYKIIGEINKLIFDEIQFKQLMNSCLFVDAIHKHYDIINQLNYCDKIECLCSMRIRFKGGLATIKEKLSENLRKIIFQSSSSAVINNENHKMFKTITEAYILLDEINIFESFFQQMFIKYVDIVSRQIVVSVVLKDIVEESFGFERGNFEDLCSKINYETDFLPCYLTILRDFCQILSTFCQFEYIVKDIMIDANDNRSNNNIQKMNCENGKSSSNTLLSVCSPRSEYNSQISMGRCALQNHMQEQICIVVYSGIKFSTRQSSTLRLATLAEVYLFTNKFLEIGQRFCGSTSEKSHKTLQQKLLNFIDQQTQKTVDDFRLSFENEMQRPLPVSNNYNIMNVREFSDAINNGGLSQHYQQLISKHNYNNQPSQINNIKAINDIQNKDTLNFINQHDINFFRLALRNVFSNNTHNNSKNYKDEINETLALNKTNLENEIQLRDFDSNSSKQPLITSVSFGVIRSIGELYLMFQVFQPISSQILALMQSIFQLYFQSIFTVFGIGVDRFFPLPSYSIAAREVTQQIIQQKEIQKSESSSENKLNKPANLDENKIVRKERKSSFSLRKGITEDRSKNRPNSVRNKVKNLVSNTGNNNRSKSIRIISDKRTMDNLMSKKTNNSSNLNIEAEKKLQQTQLNRSSSNISSSVSVTSAGEVWLHSKPPYPNLVEGVNLIRANIFSRKDMLFTKCTSYIAENMIFGNGNEYPFQQHQQQDTNIPRFVRHNSSIDFISQNNLRAIAERCISSESLVFILNMFSKIEVLLKDKNNQITNNSKSESKDNNNNFQNFHEFSLYQHKCLEEYRIYLYRNCTQFLLNFDLIFDQIQNLDQSLKELRTTHNNYVEHLADQFFLVFARIKSFCDNFPEQILRRLMRETLVYVQEKLVIGYSTKILKCSTEGRALMTLDQSVLQSKFRQIIADLFSHKQKFSEKHQLMNEDKIDNDNSNFIKEDHLNLINLENIMPSWDYINNQIKAQYFSESDLLLWIENNLYPQDAMLALGRTGVSSFSMKKRQKSEFLAKIESILSQKTNKNKKSQTVQDIATI